MLRLLCSTGYSRYLLFVFNFYVPKGQTWDIDGQIISCIYIVSAKFIQVQMQKRNIIKFKVKATNIKSTVLKIIGN